VSPVIAQADRSGWQRHAAAELARILEDHPELPCITWTIGPAGPVITGRVSGLAPSLQVRQVFRDWQRALGRGECSEQRCTGGGAWLRAADRSGAVTVRLTATVIDEREDA
jgi:hypothetical protein